MRLVQSFSRPAALSCLALALSLNVAAAQDKPFEPQVGQAGKDVIWVPTPQALVDKMIPACRRRRGRPV